MALFRRNKIDDAAVMPEEVNSYYQAENRERTWMAWLLALVTLAVTAIVIIGLFFGGRWIYRKVRHNSGSTTSVVTQKPTVPAQSNNPTPAAVTPTPNADSTAPAATGNVNAPTNPSTTSTDTAPAASTPATTSTSTVAGTSTNLPNTGPGNTLSIFAVVSIAAYVLHRRLQS